ncbi:hypothetical protein BRC83_09600 [Halobacteriales archaeon QS_1_68_17]|nr:MAG: hypothetical protein BRC83_09600 [Halobacteriales archaeon QS_1_68_17]
MTRHSDRVSRRRFMITSGAAGALALAGCTEQSGGGGGDGGGGDGDGGGSGGDGGGGGSTETATESMELSGEISITGSSTVFPLATAVAEQFQKMHSGVDISIQSTGSGGGFENFFCPGESDLNNASRPMKDSEKENCESRWPASSRSRCCWCTSSGTRSAWRPPNCRGTRSSPRRSWCRWPRSSSTRAGIRWPAEWRSNSSRRRWPACSAGSGWSRSWRSSRGRGCGSRTS